MKLIVFGPLTRTGYQFVRQALEHGHDTYAVTNNDQESEYLTSLISSSKLRIHNGFKRDGKCGTSLMLLPPTVAGNSSAVIVICIENKRFSWPWEQVTYYEQSVRDILEAVKPTKIKQILDSSNHYSTLTKYQSQIRSSDRSRKDKIIIRGAGNGFISMFNDLFDEEYPIKLQGKISIHEFKRTVSAINGIICPYEQREDRSNQMCKDLCCCLCTCGLSAYIRNWKVKRKLIAFLNYENNGVYKKLGVEWKLIRSTGPNTVFKEWVIQVSFLPRSCIFSPD
ncbi:hypothetical protein ACOME3_005568 [Neoechinorhynchus agilis]